MEGQKKQDDNILAVLKRVLALENKQADKGEFLKLKKDYESKIKAIQDQLKNIGTGGGGGGGGGSSGGGSGGGGSGGGGSGGGGFVGPPPEDKTKPKATPGDLMKTFTDFGLFGTKLLVRSEIFHDITPAIARQKRQRDQVCLCEWVHWRQVRYLQLFYNQLYYVQCSYPVHNCLMCRCNNIGMLPVYLWIKVVSHLGFA